MDNNWQVCSLVVQAKSQHINDIATQLRSFPGCEVALSDVESGQLIVVVEAEHSETLMKTIESVRNVAGVLAVSLVGRVRGLGFVGLAVRYLVMKKPSNGTKPRAVFAGRAVAYWSGRSKGVLWHARAIRMRRLTVGLTASKVTSCRKSCTEKTV